MGLTHHPQGVELPLYHYCVVVAPVLLPLLPGLSPACPATIGLKQPPFLMFFLAFLSYQGKKDILFRFIIEYSSLRDFGP
jgi:hypothetical protein